MDSQTTTNGAAHGANRWTTPTALVVAGCALFVLAVFVPVMRWEQNAAHSTAGDARIWFGDGWTLADGGFEGAALLPFASAAAVVLAVVAILAGRSAWRWQVVAALAAGYVPLWTAIAFARKWEDDVDPDIGVPVLVVATVLTATGLWLARPRDASPPAAPAGSTEAAAPPARDLS